MTDDNHTEIRKLLDALAEARAYLDTVRLDLEAKRQIILAPVREDLDALEVEYAPVLDTAQAALERMEAEAKAAVLAAGETVRSEHVMAVYMGGRVSWDDAALRGFAAANPKILNWRKVGPPSVTLRTVK